MGNGIACYFTSQADDYYFTVSRNFFYFSKKWAGWGVTYLVGISDYRICSMFVRLRIFKENPKKQSGIFAVRLA